MKRGGRILPGLEGLCAQPKRLRGQRVGLLAHPASVDARGCHASVRLRAVCGRKLVSLFGPEHGFHGRGGAGEHIADARHPAWNIPVHSLYGEHRRPTAEMLAPVDTLVFDLQDIGVRCYTFVTSLRYVMEACAAAGKALIVCDRPTPLPDVVDGPFPEPDCKSFVAGVPMPYVYGLTPGEAALYLKRVLKLDLELTVLPVQGWDRSPQQPAGLPWISPSPGIRYWETTWPYPVTVVFEAFPQIDVGRGSTEPFQVFSAPWLKAEKLAAELNRRRLPGLRFHPCWRPDPGIRFEVTAPGRLKPFAAAVHLLDVLQQVHGAEALWSDEKARPEWLDKLFGTTLPGRELRAGVPAREVLTAPDPNRATYRAARAEVLLYGKDGGRSAAAPA